MTTPYFFPSPLAECGRCHRKTWSATEVGQEDRMPQPDGFPCGGRFTGTPTPTPDSVTEHAAQAMYATINPPHPGRSWPTEAEARTDTQLEPGALLAMREYYLRLAQALADAGLLTTNKPTTPNGTKQANR